MLKISETIAVSVDIQERLLPSIYKQDDFLQKAVTLIKGLSLLEVPILVARQYPKGLGDTVGEIKEALGQHDPIDKTSFGCLGEPVFVEELEKHSPKTVLVFGIEAHVCVIQTVLQLLERGNKVVVVCDAVSSRNKRDLKIALRRVVQEGAMLSTVEAVLFELLGDSKHPQFKGISALIK